MQEARPSGAATDAPAANQNIGAASQPSRSGANSPQNLGGASADATGEQQQQQAHCLTGVPLGHTPFSWASQGATVPVGHTPFSWTGSGTATPKPPEAKKETEDFLQPSAHAPAAAATSTATSAPSPAAAAVATKPTFTIKKKPKSVKLSSRGVGEEEETAAAEEEEEEEDILDLISKGEASDSDDLFRSLSRPLDGR